MMALIPSSIARAQDNGSDGFSSTPALALRNKL